MGAVKITRMTNRDPGFYELVGPFLSRREIVAEIGAPIWDDDGKDWFVARRGKKVLGFAALKPHKYHAALVSAHARDIHSLVALARTSRNQHLFPDFGIRGQDHRCRHLTSNDQDHSKAFGSVLCQP